MTDDELDEIFASLSTILTDSGLSWLVAQVNDDIQVGRIVTRTFRHGQQEEATTLELSTKHTRSTSIGTDPYGPTERVNLLVDALRVALADSAALEQAVGQFFVSEHVAPTATVVISVHDQVVSDDSSLVIAGGNDPAAAAAQRILPLLEELVDRIAQP